jgi:hypothetical protein
MKEAVEKLVDGMPARHSTGAWLVVNQIISILVDLRVGLKARGHL